MNTKLDNITTQYRKFNVNQALTEGQLNEFIDYFEDQDRLSRTQLNGVGLVCGFETEMFSDSGQIIPGVGNQQQEVRSIVIKKGAGVTTDGDLITLRKKIVDAKEVTINSASETYTYYRQYTDTYKYPHFYSGDLQIPLLQLVSDVEREDMIAAGVGASSFHPVSEIDLEDLQKKIAILYLESYSNEETPCENADCDNNGAEQVSDLKVLLANRSDMDFYALNSNGYDSIYQRYNSYEALYNTMKNVEVPRVILKRDVTTELALRTKFQNAIQSASIISDLDHGFSAVAQSFNVSLDFGGPTLRNMLDAVLNTGSYDFQYRYDLLKDLVDTYNEIKGLVLHLTAECCPDITAFQKHLMLGPVGALLNLGDNTPYRHQFYNAPINTIEDENKDKLNLLAKRFVRMIKNFQSFKGPITITPSFMNTPLGKKALPFYYMANQSMLESWDYEKTRNQKETYNLSYHKANLAPDAFIQNPLSYNIDKNDFYRVEGFLDMPYKIAMKNINDLKEQYGLAFNVSGLSLERATTAATTTATATATATTGTTNAAITTQIAAAAATTISIKDLRAKLISISSDITNQVSNTQRALQTISGLDKELKLLNTVDFKATETGVSVVKQNPKEDKVATEFLSDLLDLKSGLEHYGGVPEGGTLYLVYKSEDDDAVLADFALPYLCCSKKDPVFLALPVTQVCQNDAPVPFTIIPLDGDIKAFVGGKEITAITQSAGQSFFNPSMVPTQNLGQPISFTVNEDPVEAVMTVHALPNVTVTAGEPIHGEVPDHPDATVVFTITGPLTGLTYSANYGDGQTRSGDVPSTGKISNIYKLVPGQKDTFTPVITISNPNGCSKKFNFNPIEIVGQTTLKCLTGLEITIQYHDTKGPCPGGHACNSARFKLLANSIPLGNASTGTNIVNLNNSSLTLQAGQAYAEGETSGRSRRWTYTILPDEAQAIVAANQPNDGFISFSLVCADSSCHTGVAWTTLKLGGAVLYNGCPKNNFLTINPCTGEIKK